MREKFDKDIHIIRYFSSYVSISEGRVIHVTNPSLAYCPLAAHLHIFFRRLRNPDKQAVRQAIKNTIEFKIRKYGFFTGFRTLISNQVTVPYGASEMLMSALQKHAIDASVVLCEGAGTVITSRPEVVQGIGGRMNSLCLTSPIKGIIEKLKALGCILISDHALIDQVRGVKEAVRLGYKTIAVTVSGQMSHILSELAFLEEKHGVKIISLVVCTTGISNDKISMIRDHADLVWACASPDIRRIIGPSARMQLSKRIPVFILTRKGMDFIAAYSDAPDLISALETGRQYLVSDEKKGQSIKMGRLLHYLNETRLPVSGKRIPSFGTYKAHVCQST
ncbi:MAG: DUF2099 family protein [Candidatus Aureabacteria bacterium]|nr:DUF2099 family protein [Candidatus Auribacterota bacterium]